MVTTLVKCAEAEVLRLIGFANDPEWQRVWLSLESEDWRSLAVLPTGAHSSLELVHGLASVAWQQRGTPLVIADLREVQLRALVAAKDELRRRVGEGERVLVAMGSLERSPTTAAMLREIDKAVICVHRGGTVLSHVKNAVQVIGAQRCLGTIMVNQAPAKDALSVVRR